METFGTSNSGSDRRGDVRVRCRAFDPCEVSTAGDVSPSGATLVEIADWTGALHILEPPEHTLDATPLRGGAWLLCRHEGTNSTGVEVQLPARTKDGLWRLRVSAADVLHPTPGAL